LLRTEPGQLAVLPSGGHIGGQWVTTSPLCEWSGPRGGCMWYPSCLLCSCGHVWAVWRGKNCKHVSMWFAFL